MEAPSPRYILSRAVFLIATLVIVLYGISFVKKYQRRAAIISELKSISSDSSFFHQFYAEDAKKSLIRAIAMIAEANELGLPPEKSIDRGLGLEAKIFASDGDKDEPDLRIKIIRASLRTNYQNFLKLGYRPDFQTLTAMKEGMLPPLPGGIENGKKAIVTTLIKPSISPGIDKVIANLEIRPPGSEDRKLTDIEVATAKQLARDLADANVIEQPVRDKILLELTPPATK